MNLQICQFDKAIQNRASAAVVSLIGKGLKKSAILGGTLPVYHSSMSLEPIFPTKAAATSLSKIHHPLGEEEKTDAYSPLSLFSCSPSANLFPPRRILHRLIHSIRLHLLAGILHFSVRRGCRRGRIGSRLLPFLLLLRLLRLLLGLLLRFLLGPLLGELLLFGFQGCLSVFFDLVLVSTHNGSGDKADLIHLGHVDPPSGVVAFVVKPFLCVWSGSMV